MKKSIITYSILLLLLLSFSTTLAVEPKETQYSIFENNLLIGLNSGNQGLETSSVYFLGEIKSEKAVIPLMAMLHSSESQAARQVAALALYKINSEIGMFAVKRAIKFDDDKQTRKLCKIFYNQHLLREHEGYVEVEPIFVTKLNKEYGGYKLSDFAR